MRKYMKDATPFILNKQYFKTETLRGEHVGAYPNYVIYSYSTPIAIFANGLWYLTDAHYSATTATQQSALRLILEDERVITLNRDMMEAQAREVGAYNV